MPKEVTDIRRGTPRIDPRARRGGVRPTKQLMERRPLGPIARPPTSRTMRGVAKAGEAHR